ncbi:MAG: HAD family phosphatase [Prolixibacteraceae bacterium]|nr:HAD family phosphatase [Prolixibacteraceae bacterium]
MDKALPVYKNVIFDLGVVIMNIEPQLTLDAFKRLGISGNWNENDPLIFKMEKGELTEPEFMNEIRKRFNIEASDRQIDEAWCAMVIGFDQGKIKFLQELKSYYSIYLFSNTNSIHVRLFKKLFEDQFHFPIDNLFVKTFYSNEIGLRKPDPASFQKVFKIAGIKAPETLFVDDRKENVEGAASVKLQTSLYKEGDSLISAFEI